MYSYKFAGGTKPIESACGPNVPKDFIIFDGGAEVDWSKKDHIDGKLVDVTVPEPPAPYEPTAEELLAQVKNEKQWDIKAKLQATDYLCLKFVDGAITAEEYESTKTARAALRKAYNKIESAATLEEVQSVTY